MARGPLPSRVGMIGIVVFSLSLAQSLGLLLADSRPGLGAVNVVHVAAHLFGRQHEQLFGKFLVRFVELLLVLMGGYLRAWS